jgi:PAS domain-containing protein
MSEARIETLLDELDQLRPERSLESVIVLRPQADLLQRVLGDRIVLESLPEIVSVLDRDLSMLYLNRTVPGRVLEDQIGTCVLDYLPVESHARYRAAFETAWQLGQAQCLEFTSLGQYTWQTRFVPVREEGQVVLMLVTAADVTERVAAERMLRESENRLRHAIDVAGMGTWTHDWRSDVIVWDAALCVIYGIRRIRSRAATNSFCSACTPRIASASTSRSCAAARAASTRTSNTASCGRPARSGTCSRRAARPTTRRARRSAHSAQRSTSRRVSGWKSSSITARRWRPSGS